MPTVLQFLAVWSNSAVWFGRLVVYFRLSGFYLFGRLVSAVWSSLFLIRYFETEKNVSMHRNEFLPRFAEASNTFLLQVNLRSGASDEINHLGVLSASAARFEDSLAAKQRMTCEIYSAVERIQQNVDNLSSKVCKLKWSLFYWPMNLISLHSAELLFLFLQRFQFCSENPNTTGHPKFFCTDFEC